MPAGAGRAGDASQQAATLTVLIDAKQAGFTGVEGQIPAFKVEGVTFIAKELILEMEESVYRGDMYRFLVRATSTQRQVETAEPVR